MSAPDVVTRPNDVMTPAVSKHRGLLEEVWHNFKKNRLSLTGGVIVLIAIILAVFAPVFAPHDPVKQFKNYK